MPSLSFLKSFPAYETFSKEYEQLFSLSFGKMAAPLVESVYKKWTENPNIKLPQARLTGYIQGDSYSHMQSLLNQLQIILPKNCQADELSVILDVYAVLIEYAPIDSVQDFAEHHLDWLDHLEQRLTVSVEKHNFGQIFQQLLELSKTLIELDTKYYLP